MNLEKLKIVVPVPPSVNACYQNCKAAGRRGRVLTEAARNWKLLAGYAAKAAARSAGWEIAPKGIKVVLEIYAFWPDGRRHDMNNSHKLLCDAWEGILYEDDCSVLTRDMDFSIDRKRPRLECVVYLKGQEA